MRDILKGMKLFTAYYMPPKMIIAYLAVCIPVTAAVLASDPSADDITTVLLGVIGFFFVSVMYSWTSAVLSRAFVSSEYAKTGSIYAPVIMNWIVFLFADAVYILTEILYRNAGAADWLQGTAILMIFFAVLNICNIFAYKGKLYSVFFIAFMVFFKADMSCFLKNTSLSVLGVTAAAMIFVSAIVSVKLSRYLYRITVCTPEGFISGLEKKKRKRKERKEKKNDRDGITVFDKMSLFSLHEDFKLVSAISCAAGILLVMINVGARTTTIKMTPIMTAAFFLTGGMIVLKNTDILSLPSGKPVKFSYGSNQKFLMSVPGYERDLVTVTAVNFVLITVCIFCVPLVYTVVRAILIKANGTETAVLLPESDCYEVWYLYSLLFAVSGLYVAVRKIASRGVEFLYYSFTCIASGALFSLRELQSIGLILIYAAAGILLYSADIIQKYVFYRKKQNRIREIKNEI